MSFLSNLLASVGHFFSSLFTSTEKVYEELSEKEQQVSKQASGILAIINANLSTAPDIVWQLISTAFPELTKEQVTAALAKAGQVLGALDKTFSGSFEDALATLQAYLNGHEGNTWITITKAAASIIADVLAPGTVIQKIELVMEYVYQTFIKGKVATAPVEAGIPG